ncbi:LacI family DNA-binding transcriptional regulator (plasmid) [Mesorhizobium sp. AR10]|uniref:LacI family DNA-binding transcriptional regulator n=1 Tax=Mesorhizobium sp. AR10 TaxID=2865839 RepID=UPI002160FC54|nr:LacI family DNA-binding transcriptional regulator [Mesorhizobium sp. AR10]UVK35788.1 LacI family DNA-binding transcriptional regulator [Mesorhizobium sp. AR10]
MTSRAPRQRRKRSPRFLEIAKAAGVSVATVDRVLNERESVSEKKRLAVIRAATNLRVPRILPNTEHALVHFDILLPANSTPFFQRLNNVFKGLGDMLDRRFVLHRRRVLESRIDKIVAAIQSPGYKRKGLVLAVPNHPRLRGAVEEAIARGEPVATVATDLPGIQGVHYCGIDQFEAGATAAHIMGRMSRGQGRVLVIGARSDYHGHQERQEGFAATISRFDNLVLETGSIDSHDDPERCFRAVSSALRRTEPLCGVYNTGAGSQGVLRAMQEVSKPGEIIWITHEFSADHRSYLQDGWLEMAIDQDPEGQALAAIQYLLFRNIGQISASRGELRLFFRTHVAS